MTSITHPSQTVHPTLIVEAGLAARLIRSGKIPLELWQWLVSPATFPACKHGLADPQLTLLFSEMLSPMLSEAQNGERQEARYAAGWLGAISRCAAGHCDQLRLGVGKRMLAASMLPLYRSLATGHLAEGFREARGRLSELLSLLALCHEVGNDLVQLLDSSNQRMDAPNLVLSSQFDVNLMVIAQIVCEQAYKFETELQQFNPQGVEELARYSRQQSARKTVDWAAPELLWKLAGELISKNSELVLPRCWIETPVPWNNISDHWSRLSMQLSCTTAVSGTVGQATCNPTPAHTLASLQNSPAQSASATLTSSAGTSALGTDPQDLSRVHVTGDEMQALRTIQELRACIQPSSEKAAVAIPAIVAQSPAMVIPKVLIAEIRSHNDPVFVNVIRRQIAKCRTEDRALSLVSMVVLPEDGNVQHSVRENGLTLWQQRLVNWLADHPQVVEPHAFLTSEGELLLCLLDLERNETTSLIRHGLVEVLTGQQLGDCEGSALAKVNVPGRYHAGIASTSSPGAAFGAEQLIEPAIRCLSAASRHGTASIKSIEVY